MAYIERIKNITGRYPTTFRCDNAKEFISKSARKYLNDRGITLQPSTAYTPQENSLAERINQTIMRTTRASLQHSKLDDTCWADAVQDAVFKYNITYNSSVRNLPYTLWNGEPPKLSKILAFGQLGSIPSLTPNKPKPQLRAEPVRYMHGVSDDHIKVYNLRTQKYQLTRTVNFTPYQHRTDPCATTNIAFRTEPPLTFLPKRHPSPKPDDPHITINTPPPKTAEKAKHYPDAKLWETAHNNELDQLDSRNAITWLPQQHLPPRHLIVPMTWTYRYKQSLLTDPIERKARCSVRGNRMLPNVHYDPSKTATYMADKTAIRILLALTASQNLIMEHFDITGAYLHERYDPNKPVYVWQPKRFDGTYKHKEPAGRLNINIYGTPPAAYIYTSALYTYLKAKGYTQIQSDVSIFFKKSGTHYIIIAVSMDDFLVCATNITLINEFHQHLSAKYKVKRLGTPTSYLNWKLTFTKTGIHVAQPSFINKIAERLQMSEANTRAHPYTSGIDLDPPRTEEPARPEITDIYSEIVGDLRYLADCTRFDIAFITAALARALKQPTERHWQHLKRTVRYLMHTQSHGLFFPYRQATDLHSYADADYARCKKTRKSMTGHIHLIGNAPIHWLSKQQSTVALSTCEAEYISAAGACQDTLWINNLLTELPINHQSKPQLFVDNNSAVQVANSVAPTKKRKHIHIRHLYLQDHAECGTLRIIHIPSTNMVADLLTKPLSEEKFQQLRTTARLLPNASSPCVRGTDTPKQNFSTHGDLLNITQHNNNSKDTPDTPNYSTVIGD